jgi:hypothetical protein
MQRVVIIGHSSGGQFVNRYAAGGAGCPDPAVAVRYVVMNPSSYLYLSALRPSASGEFETPGAADTCPEYDEYKYGLHDLNSYMAGVGVEAIRENLFTRDTYYLAGEEDTSNDGNLDVTCSGILQGENRFERFRGYRSYAGLFAEWTGSIFLSVPDVGHSSSRMLMSDAARSLVFDRDPPPQTVPTPYAPTLIRIDPQAALG